MNIQKKKFESIGQWMALLRHKKRWLLNLLLQLNYLNKFSMIYEIFRTLGMRVCSITFSLFVAIVHTNLYFYLCSHCAQLFCAVMSVWYALNSQRLYLRVSISCIVNPIKCLESKYKKSMYRCERLVLA